MNPPQQSRIARAVLLAASIPMVLAHFACSFLMVFPLVSLLGGDLNQGIFLLWWAVGTVGVVALVYSSATFGSSQRLRPWQWLGLIGGMLAALPVIFGFFGDWWMVVSAVLSACVAGYILINSALRPYVSKDVLGNCK